MIDSDDYTLNPEEIDATSAVTNILLGYYSAFAERGLKPQIALPDHALYLMADPTAFLRMVHNLLSNAIRYTEGSIHISQKGEEDGFAVFCIKNETSSLSMKDAEHLFDRFYRADKSRMGANAGLGLYIVKTLAEKMNARIESEPEDGWLSISVFFSRV